MALNRLLLGIGVLSVVFIHSANAQQFEPTTAKQDGIMIMDALGRIFSVGEDGDFNKYVFKELEESSNQFEFPFDVARDLEFVANPNGSPKGAYLLDSLGGQFELTLENTPDFISSPSQVAAMHEDFSQIPYFGWDVARDIEIAPDWREETHGYRGYFVLDADGVVHPVGDTNLPSYVYTNPETGEDEIRDSLFPGTIDISGSEVTETDLLQGGPINYSVNQIYSSNPRVDSVTPVYTYFGLGSEIARDLEISVETVQLTAPSQTHEDEIENRTIAMTNGYYILDGYGAVHSCRLPLDFDANNDGEILYEDMLEEGFGKPINNTVISPAWVEDRGNLPYFGVDVAVDIEMTPSGQGFYLLDSYGSIFAVGDASLSFPPREVDGSIVPSKSSPPYFGIPIASDLSVITNEANESLGVSENEISTGLVVLTGYGSVHPAGLASSYNVADIGDEGSTVVNYSFNFRMVETTPIWVAGDPGVEDFQVGKIFPPVEDFVVGNENVPASSAPNYRNVTAAYSTITESYTPITEAD